MNAIGRIEADRVIDALGEGGVEESALVLEVIPAFEQDDDAVLDDLVSSVEYWRDGARAAGACSPTSGVSPRASRTSARARRRGCAARHARDFGPAAMAARANQAWRPGSKGR
jgi:hypothetical protein